MGWLRCGIRDSRFSWAVPNRALCSGPGCVFHQQLAFCVTICYWMLQVQSRDLEGVVLMAFRGIHVSIYHWACKQASATGESAITQAPATKTQAGANPLTRQHENRRYMCEVMSTDARNLAQFAGFKGFSARGPLQVGFLHGSC